MPSRFNLPPELDIGQDEDFTKDRLDQAFDYIVKKFLILDSFQPSYQEQVDLLRLTGLERLNESLQPVYDKLVAIANIGVIFSALSETSVEVGTGIKMFQVSENDRQRFAPTAYMVVATGDTLQIMMKGSLQSYNRDTGILTLNVVTTLGSGTHDTWTISPTAPDNVAGAYTDQHIEQLRQELINGASGALDSFGEIEARIKTLIGTASTAADTLGELEATATLNRQRAADDAVAMSIALG